MSIFRSIHEDKSRPPSLETRPATTFPSIPPYNIGKNAKAVVFQISNRKLGRDDWLVFWLFFQSNWKTKYLLPKWRFHFFQLNIWLFCISFQYTYLKKLLELIENTYENAYDFDNTSYFTIFLISQKLVKFYLTNNLSSQNSNICTLQSIVQMRKYDALNQISHKPIKLIFFAPINEI